MLTGEYFALDGAKVLAFPTVYGQKMVVKNTVGSDLIWKSFDQRGEKWFDCRISLYDFSALKSSNEEISFRLKRLLKNAVRLNSEFLNNWKGMKVECHLEFPIEWGLGSSSTLTSLVADWADINPFLLYFKISNGSGYDIACTKADGPLLYQLEKERLRFEEIDWNPCYSDNLYFVYLNNKVDSNKAIEYYVNKAKNISTVVDQLSAITEEIIKCNDQNTFMKLLDDHEHIVSKSLKLPTIKAERFSDFEGNIKSLGAWGGDFVLASSMNDEKYIRNYFESKGHHHILRYNELVYGAMEEVAT